MPPHADDPLSSFNFSVELGSEVAVSFSEVSGLDIEIDVIEYRTGSEDITPRKIPGLKKFANITLKRGMTINNTLLYDWLREFSEGTGQRRDISIVLHDTEGNPLTRWNIRRAWPCKWAGPTLRANESEVAIETLEIAHEGFRIET